MRGWRRTGTGHRPGPVVSGALLVVGGATAATASVPNFRTWIVAVYCLLLIALAVALGRRRVTAPVGVVGCAVALVAAGVATLAVPGFSYLTSGQAGRLRWALAVVAFAAAAVLVLWRRRPAAALGVALVGYIGAAAYLIHLDPAPDIDVWFILQGATHGLAHGQNAYTTTWLGPHGVHYPFTYPPWTIVLLAPVRWLTGDVRWSLVVATVVGVLLLQLLPGRTVGRQQRATVAGLGALVLLLPGTSTQVEQAWTEPLLFCLLAGIALAWTRRRFWLSVLLCAVAIASKQHLALMLPLLAAWPRFGWRRSLATAGGAVVLMLPWIVADPSAIWHDTVSLLVHFWPIHFSDTLYLAAINDLGWQPPFWLTGLVVAAVLAVCLWFVHRRDPEPPELLAWWALLLFSANLVNKQAFYNQFWLVGATLLIAWAAATHRDDRSVAGQLAEVAEPGLGERRLGDAEDRLERGAGRSVR
jgi:hypothetical protein